MAFLLIGLYLHNFLHFSLPLTGEIIAIYGLGAIIASPLGGWFSDIFGPVAVMCLSLALTSLSVFSFLLFKSPLTLSVLMLIWALTYSCFRPANMVAVSFFCTPEQRKLAFAVNRLAANIGLSIAPILGGVLANVDFRLIFILDGILMFAAVFIIFFSLRKHWHTMKVQEQNFSFSDLQIPFQNKAFRLMIIPLILIMTLYCLTHSPLALFMVQSLGFKPYLYGLLFAINTVLIVVVEIPVNLATNHWTARRTICLGSLLITCCFGIFAVAYHFITLALGMIIFTAGEVFFQPGTAAYIAEISPPQQRGIYMGLYNLCFCVGLVTAPIFGTYLLNAFPSHTVWWIASVLGLGASCLFWRGLGARPK